MMPDILHLWVPLSNIENTGGLVESRSNISSLLWSVNQLVAQEEKAEMIFRGGRGCSAVKMTTGRNEGRNCKLAVRSKQKEHVFGSERKDSNEICLRECKDVLFFADEVTCRRAEEHQQEQNVPKVPWDAAHCHGPLTPK